MPQTRVALPLASFLTKASLHLPRVFSPYIYMAHPPHFLYFIFADFLERKFIAFDSVNSSFTSIILSAVNLKAFLQKVILPVSFYFLLFHIIYLYLNNSLVRTSTLGT